MGRFGQGATEYLVLLAVVLIIALVGIALLGFFPGTASDAQAAESQIYWQSQSPIAITEWAARARVGDATRSLLYLRIRNNGQYPVRITKLVGGSQAISQVYSSGLIEMSQLYYIAPGEEAYFGYSSVYGLPTDREVDFTLPVSTYCNNNPTITLCTAQSVCALSPPYGTFAMKDFGFEYIQYVEGQQITKRQIGSKPLAIKCREPF